MEKEDLTNCTAKELVDAVAPHSLLERFAAKKSVAVGQNKDFLSIKGQAGQIENVTRAVMTPNQ